MVTFKTNSPQRIHVLFQMLVGNALMYLTTTDVTPDLGQPAGVMGVVYMVAQIGAQCLYMATITTNVKVFPQKYRAFGK